MSIRIAARGLRQGMLLLVTGALLAQKVDAADVQYKGTMGEQHVTVSLEIRGESLHGGHYRYDTQASEIRFTEVRFFGTTAVLQDEDGNTLHLHLRRASGEGAPDWAEAAALDGTMVRGDLDLPVKLTRAAPGEETPP